MYKKSFSLLIILISIALGGIIFMQLYWVQNALELKEEQFSHGIRIGLKSVVNRLLRDSSPEQPSTCTALQSFVTDSIMFLEVVPKEMLETYLFEEMKELGVMGDITYGIYHSDRKDMVFCSNAGMEDLITSSLHLVSLSCLISDDPYFLAIHIPSQKSLILKQMTGWLTLSFLFLAAVVFGFVYIINGWMRQKKLSEMKNDFINNMTHEFKTPISTVALACEALTDSDIQKSESLYNSYISIISEENKRLGVMAEKILQTAIIEKGQVRLKQEKFDLHHVIEDVIRNIRIQVEIKDGTIAMALHAGNSQVVADRVHVSNVIYNLLDNANKYTPRKPEIRITTENNEQGIWVKVADNGIGISKAHQRKVFDKLYRVPTGDVHDFKGFGLGLSYVKAIVEQHGGVVGLESELNKGSEFRFFLPQHLEGQG